MERKVGRDSVWPESTILKFPAMASNPRSFDRRQIYRPFLERLTPEFSGAEFGDLIVPPAHDPRDPDQPPIHVAFASTAELNRGVQLALVGGIGSGKTTELRLTANLLKRHQDAVNIFVDVAEMTDIDGLNPGALLIAIGIRLNQRLLLARKQTPETKVAFNQLQSLAHGKTEWVQQYPEVPEAEDIENQDEDFPPIPIHTPGQLKPRFPAITRDVGNVRDLVIAITAPLLEADAQITVLIDGLDRLIRPERFRGFVEQDLRALRDHKISVIVAAPLLSWFDQTKFLQDYFEEVRHIPAAVSDPEKSDFLKEVLVRRGALGLMDERGVADLARFSGGVLRDLITLARTSAEAAYRDDADRIAPNHIETAISQMGKRYLTGLGHTHRFLLRRLIDNRQFPLDNPVAKELLVNRQVLEYCTDGLDSFAVHPALEHILSGLE